MLEGTPEFDDEELDLGYLRKLERDMARVTDEDNNDPIPGELLHNEDSWHQIKHLIWCASSPIIRGREYGVVGMGDLVVKAREGIKAIMDNKDPNPRLESGTLDYFKSFQQPDWTSAFVCSRCRGAI